MFIEDDRSHVFRIPVRVVNADRPTVTPEPSITAHGESASTFHDARPEGAVSVSQERATGTPNSDAVGVPSRPEFDQVSVGPMALDQEIDWRAQALRLQAEMDRFRKRQIQRAEDAIAAERERLLRLMLSVVDNLMRVLDHSQPTDDAVRHGVELTCRELIRQLQAEGVRPIQAVGQPFDPHWHEAVAVRPAGVPPGTVIEEIETGYQLNGKLLRPARVVVAA